MATNPVILVDMDGPLADFDTAIWKFINDFGLLVSCTQATQTHRYVEDATDPIHKSTLRNRVDSAGFFRTLPLTPGAREGMEALSKVAEVWICSKPLEKNPTCRDDKAAWIEEFLGSPWVDRLILAPDKSLVQGAVLLDDAPKSKWYSRATWKPVIFPTPWNAEGSLWGGLPRWTWGDNIDTLLNYGGRPDKETDFEDVELPLEFPR